MNDYEKIMEFIDDVTKNMDNDEYESVLHDVIEDCQTRINALREDVDFGLED